MLKGLRRGAAQDGVGVIAHGPRTVLHMKPWARYHCLRLIGIVSIRQGWGASSSSFECIVHVQRLVRHCGGLESWTGDLDARDGPIRLISVVPQTWQIDDETVSWSERDISIRNEDMKNATPSVTSQTQESGLSQNPSVGVALLGGVQEASLTNCRGAGCNATGRGVHRGFLKLQPRMDGDTRYSSNSKDCYFANRI